MTTYGYARVSSDGQCLDAQREAFAAAGAVTIFAEKLSGASAANRKELAKVLAKLGSGDVLGVEPHLLIVLAGVAPRNRGSPASSATER
jgi:DNA invertase Pin-like site-specific DNA recombinase